jgi:hypothetical protein
MTPLSSPRGEHTFECAYPAASAIVESSVLRYSLLKNFVSSFRKSEKPKTFDFEVDSEVDSGYHSDTVLYMTRRRIVVRRKRRVRNRRSNGALTVRTGRGAYGFSHPYSSLVSDAIGASGELANAIPAKRSTTFVNKVAKALGALGGGALGFAASGGNPFTAMQSAFAGGTAGNALSRFAGYGRYTVKNNSIMMNPMPMHQDNEKIVLRHRECLGDVFSSATSGAFSITSYTINPGNLAAFPWLAPIAQNFQFWKPRGIVATFVSELSDAISNTSAQTLGSIMMVTQYDSNATAPSSKIMMLNEHFACEGKASQDLAHPIECDPSQRITKELLVRTTASLPANDDARLYDLGTLFIASTGVLTDGTHQVQLGTLWLEYEIELNIPVISAFEGSALPVAHYRTTSPADAHPFNAMVKVYDSIGLGVNTSIDTIVWPASTTDTNFLIFYAAHGTSRAGLSLTGTPDNGATSILLFKSGSNSQWDNNGTTATDLFHVRALNVQANYPEYSGVPGYVMSAATLPTSSTSADLFVIALPNNIS